jgi:hypothetical protein
LTMNQTWSDNQSRKRAVLYQTYQVNDILSLPFIELYVQKNFLIMILGSVSGVS